jgi:hypothetical protein
MLPECYRCVKEPLRILSLAAYGEAPSAGVRNCLGGLLYPNGKAPDGCSPPHADPHPEVIRIHTNIPMTCYGIMKGTLRLRYAKRRRSDGSRSPGCRYSIIKIQKEEMRGYGLPLLTCFRWLACGGRNRGAARLVAGYPDHPGADSVKSVSGSDRISAEKFSYAHHLSTFVLD